jgi:hypothetical protein
VKEIVKDYNLTRYDGIKSKTVMHIEKYYPVYEGYSCSIVVALRTVGADCSYAKRKEIAKANGICEYKGTAEQNIKMLELLKAGKLIKI